MNVPKVLLDKYNSPVPRYTSYPPANFFTDSFQEEDYIKSIKLSNECDPQNISIYIHIPYCKRMCFFCGCNSSPMPRNHTVDDYINAVKTEIEMVVKHIDKKRKLSQIHYGGGTPNAIPVHHLRELNDLILSQFDKIENAEIAIECNPALLDRTYTDELNKAGFNRYSLGVQDLNADILKSVNREVPDVPISEYMDYIRDGNENAVINLDFIYGLPGQTVDSFLDNMERAVKMKPERLVTFSYAHVPWVNKAQSSLEKKGLPDPLEKVEMFLTSHQLLQDRGYKPIGLDHYVLEQDEMYKAYKNNKLHRNFQGYCTRETTGQVYAFGVSSISQMEKHYSQNTKSIEDYIKVVNSGHLPVIKGYSINEREIIIREVINELMCNLKINFEILSERMNLNIDEIKSNIRINKEALQNFADDGIIEFDENNINMTEDGLLFIRNVAASLDPLLDTQKKSFSKSV